MQYTSNQEGIIDDQRQVYAAVIEDTGRSVYMDDGSDP